MSPLYGSREGALGKGEQEAGSEASADIDRGQSE